jgi:hypothetical protein
MIMVLFIKGGLRVKPFSINKKIIIACVLGFCGFALLRAQTAAEIEALLETPAVSYAQAARVALKAAEAADAAEVSGLEEAFAFAAERNWLPKNASPDAEARLDGVSLLFMRAFGIRGGLFYSLIKNPHYAYREMERRNAFKGRSDPRSQVSGDQLLFITGRVLSITEGE